MGRHIHFLWTTALGGVFFLLPLVVLFALLGRVYSIVVAIAVPLHAWIPVNSPIGIALLFKVSLLLLVLICFLAGMIARRTMGKKFSNTLERYLIMVFPKYAIYKDLLAGNLASGHAGPSLTPILVACPEGDRLAFQADTLSNGDALVFLPGAPDPWIGSIVVVPRERVLSIDLPFAEAVGVLERLGRDSRPFHPKLTRSRASD